MRFLLYAVAAALPRHAGAPDEQAHLSARVLNDLKEVEDLSARTKRDEFAVQNWQLLERDGGGDAGGPVERLENDLERVKNDLQGDIDDMLKEMCKGRITSSWPVCAQFQTTSTTTTTTTTEFVPVEERVEAYRDGHDDAANATNATLDTTAAPATTTTTTTTTTSTTTTTAPAAPAAPATPTTTTTATPWTAGSVRHMDGDTQTADWGQEYGPRKHKKKALAVLVSLAVFAL